MTQTRARTADLGVLLVIWSLAIGVTRLPLFADRADVLGPAVIVDLTLTAGLVHWWLGVRRGGLPAWTVSLVLVVGVALGSVVAPGHGMVALAVAGVAELVVAGVALARGRTWLATYQERRAAGWGVADAGEAGLVAALESEMLARAARTEVELLWLCGIGWTRRPEGGGFSHHREAGWGAVLGALMLLMTGEGVAAHLMLDAFGWSAAAWVMTALHVYGALWLVGDAQALRLYRTTVTADGVDVRVGLRWSARLEWDAIAGAERCLEADDEDVDVSVFGAPNVRVALARPVEVRGPFGIARTARSVCLQVDDAEEFVARVRRGARSGGP